MGESIEGAGPSAAALVATEAVFSDVRVEVACILEPPRSEVQVLLRQSADGRYGLRLSDDGYIAVERLLRGPDGKVEMSWLARSRLARYGARWRDRQTSVVASMVGSAITMEVDGQVVITCSDPHVRNGRVAVAMTVTPNESSSVTLTRVEVRIPGSRPSR